MEPEPKGLQDLMINNEFVHQQRQRQEKLKSFIKDVPEVSLWLRHMTIISDSNNNLAVTLIKQAIDGISSPISTNDVEKLVAESAALNQASEIILRNAEKLYEEAKAYREVSEKVLTSREALREIMRNMQSIGA